MTNDDVSEDTEFFGFKISKPQGADLRGQRSEVVADVGLVDDDARGVTIDPTSIGLHEPASEETAVAGSYTVNLNSKPTDTVTVTIGGGDPAVSLSGDTLTNKQLTFTTTNWNTAQTITVTPVKDDNAVGETITLTHTLSGGDYAGIAADSVTVNLTDSDARNLVLSEESRTVTEGDATGVGYTIKLATQPSGEVTVTVSGHAGTDLTLDKTTLTFTVDNWDVAQTVTVEAGQDDDAANDTATLTHSASGGDYAGITVDLPVTVTDDDEAGVTIEPTALSVVAGRSNEYTLALATEPTGEVTVTISGHASTDVTLDKTTLTFTVDNWDTAQTVTVSATQNAATGKVPLAHAVAGADYGSVTAEPVVVSVVGVAGQQPTLQVGVSSSAQTLTVPEGGANSYTLVLGSRPTGDVTVGVTLPTGTDLTLDKTALTFTMDNWDDAQTVAVTAAEDDDAVTDAVVRLTHTVSGHAGTDLTLDKTTLTFTVDNWDTAQTVTVKAGEDDDASNETATLTHTASGGDYALVSNTLPVTVTDDDEPAVVLSETGLTVTEGDAAGSSYTVKLATRPSASVSVSITGHAGTDLTLDKTTLTFTVGNWDTAQTVTVKAGEDDDASNETATLTHTASGGDYASVSNTLPVTLTDDDTAAIVLSKTGLSVTEGDAAGTSYTLRLATEPTGEVTVTISGHDGADLTLDKTTLTFTVDNWDTAQTVTVKAGQDNDGANDIATLTHTASGGDYASVSNTLPVSITDDDIADVTIEPTALSVVAGRSNEYTVRLATEPTGEVTVTVSGHASADVTLDKTTLTFTTDNWATVQTVIPDSPPREEEDLVGARREGG